jgi:tRNA(adenine34) deaminase
MRHALQQAAEAAEAGEVPTGCVIVQTSEKRDIPRGTIIGRAHNQVEMLKDPTAHSEMIAITQASAAIGDFRLTETILYVTKEPCAMCAGAIVLARIPVVVYGASDPKRGADSLFNIMNHPNLIHRAKIISGVLRDESLAILVDFFRERRTRGE